MRRAGEGQRAAPEISVAVRGDALRGGRDPFGFASGQAPPLNDMGSGTHVPERQYSILPPPQRPRHRGSVRVGNELPAGGGFGSPSCALRASSLPKQRKFDRWVPVSRRGAVAARQPAVTLRVPAQGGHSALRTGLLFTSYDVVLSSKQERRGRRNRLEDGRPCNGRGKPLPNNRGRRRGAREGRGGGCAGEGHAGV